MHSVKRIWKGIEMEGPETGILTYFVESTKMDDETVIFLNSFILEHPDCERVYLGANTTDVVEYGKLFFEKKLSCRVVVMEIGTSTFSLHPELMGAGQVLDGLIVRQTVSNVDVTASRPSLVFKIDVPGKYCQTWSTPGDLVNTGTVENGLYNGVDVEVYRR